MTTSSVTLADWLDAERGRTNVVADACGVTKSAVSQWRTTGVPMRHMGRLRDLSGGALTIEGMVFERVSEAA